MQAGERRAWSYGSATLRPHLCAAPEDQSGEAPHPLPGPNRALQREVRGCQMTVLPFQIAKRASGQSRAPRRLASSWRPWAWPEAQPGSAVARSVRGREWIRGAGHCPRPELSSSCPGAGAARRGSARQVGGPAGGAAWAELSLVPPPGRCSLAQPRRRTADRWVPAAALSSLRPRPARPEGGGSGAGYCPQV